MLTTSKSAWALPTDYPTPKSNTACLNHHVHSVLASGKFVAAMQFDWIIRDLRRNFYILAPAGRIAALPDVCVTLRWSLTGAGRAEDFRMGPHLTTKECPCHVYSDLVPNIWTNNVQRNHQRLRSRVLAAHTSLWACCSSQCATH